MAASTATKKAPSTRRKAAPKKASSDVDLSHLVPDAQWHEDYVSRDIGGIEDLTIMENAHANMRNLLLFGPTGPGKTTLVMAYAAAKKLPIVTLACNGAIDPSVTFGGPQMDEDRKIFYQESETIAVIRQGGILYLDEVNFMPGRIGAVFHSLLDRRRQVTLLDKGNELVKAHPDLFICAAYNPEYADTRPLNAAFKNRFAIKLHFDYERSVEEELVDNTPLLDLSDQLRERHRSGDLDTPVSTNMLITFEEVLLDLGFAFAVENFLANFESSEMSSVREVFELNRDRIETEAEKLIKYVEEA